MSNLENANVKSAEERKRAEMHRTYGMWYKEGATASDLVSWCDARIAVYSEWIKNCTELKHSSQAQLLSGMSKEALEAALAALNANSIFREVVSRHWHNLIFNLINHIY